MKYLNQLIVVPTIPPCFQGNTLSLVRLVRVRNVMLELYNHGINQTAIVLNNMAKEEWNSRQGI
jgi:hypothetical protein